MAKGERIDSATRPFDKASIPGDDLVGHELLQFAWLKAHGHVKKRGESLHKKNPVMAVDNSMPDRKHKLIDDLQRESKLHDAQRLLAMTARENAIENAKILLKEGYPKEKVALLLSKTLAYIDANNL